MDLVLGDSKNHMGMALCGRRKKRFKHFNSAHRVEINQIYLSTHSEQKNVRFLLRSEFVATEASKDVVL